MTNSSVETFECVGFDSRPQIMIEFRLANGNAIALSYACLICAEFDASGAIILTFTDYIVSSEGKTSPIYFTKSSCIIPPGSRSFRAARF
ncbi:MAG: hypothetical protein HC888_10855 [Candidatus Competibacteraceae bacterium]|nr:hypothetical protein [Candidatus Competibacteraceae bacterium]